MVKQALGKEIHVMVCNGKRYPFKNEFSFELILFGTSNNGKAKIHASFDKD
jgi:hypothetical protein